MLKSVVTNLLYNRYQPKDNGLQFVAESYGGHYGPVFSAYIEEQNERLVAGKLPPGTKELHLSSLGIGKGFMDTLSPSSVLNTPIG